MDRVRDDLEVSTELRGTVFEFTSQKNNSKVFRRTLVFERVEFEKSTKII